MHSDRHQASGSEAPSGALECVSMSEAGVDALFSNLSSACSSQIWPWGANEESENVEGLPSKLLFIFPLVTMSFKTLSLHWRFLLIVSFESSKISFLDCWMNFVYLSGSRPAFKLERFPAKQLATGNLDICRLWAEHTFLQFQSVSDPTLKRHGVYTLIWTAL